MNDYFDSELNIGDVVFHYDIFSNPRFSRIVKDFNFSLGHVLLEGGTAEIDRLVKPSNVILVSTLKGIFNYPRKEGMDFFGNEITEDSEILYAYPNLEVAKVTKVTGTFTEFVCGTITSRQNEHLFNIKPLKALKPELFL